MKNYQIPKSTCYGYSAIALNVPFWVAATTWQNVTTISIKPKFAKFDANRLRLFARDKDYYAFRRTTRRVLPRA
jgi:hypothetical protein